MNFLLEKMPDFEVCFKAAILFQAFHICVWFYTWVYPDPNPKMNEWKYHGSKAFYYLFITMAEIRILVGYPWMPTLLGGLGAGNWEDAAYRARCVCVCLCVCVCVFVSTYVCTCVSV